MKRKLPLPSIEMRQLVGPTDEKAFSLPSAGRVFPDIPPRAYKSVFDFGCGCGRIARQLLQLRRRPRRYVGIDIHRGMINWCCENLAPRARGFEFLHHDVFNAGLNPGADKPEALPFPAPDRSFSLVLAWSVFTHLLERQAAHYIKEVSRILSRDGTFLSTWFLFDKREFPMMQEFQNALFINDGDPTNAVIYDREWLRNAVGSAGLRIVHVVPPEIRGFQWVLHMVPSEADRPEVEIPADTALYGINRPPVPKTDVSRVGLRES